MTRTGRCEMTRTSRSSSLGKSSAKLTRNLTLHYKREIYLAPPGSETLRLAGERCCVHESEDGRIEVRHQGTILP